MRHKHHRCPVTALASFGHDLLLIGEGNYLNLYQVRQHRHGRSIKIFESQAVHGIVISADRKCVVVWGGRFIRLLVYKASSQHLIFDLSEVLSVDDWILDVAFASDHVRHSAGLVTAHNALWRITFEEQCNEDTALSSDQPVKAVLESEVSGSNCILYSAHIKRISVSHCLIASGTAFGDVILWSVFFDEDNATRSEVHFTYSAHEGSVFGMQISSLMKLAGHEEERRVLASCSDDRTIRLWDISDLNARSPSLTEIQRETGFGSRPSTAAHAPPLLAKVMGHASRVWHVRFLSDRFHPRHTGPKILSCGEDASANTWRLVASSSETPYKLELLDARSSHSGKNLWSVTEGPGSLVTGGADGAITHYTTPLPEDGPRHRVLNTDKLSPGDNFKAYTFVSDELISTTEQGRIVVIRMANGTDYQDEVLRELSAPLPGLRGYSVIASLNRIFDGTAFVSGTDGTIYCYAPSHTSADASRLLVLARRPGKTAGLFVATSERRCMYLLATGIGSAPASLYVLDETRGTWPPFEHDGLEDYRLTIPHGVIVTSFAVFRNKHDFFDVFVGSRQGAILVYRVATSLSHDPVEPISTRDATHGKEAVTSIAVNQDKDDPDRWIHITSTGRDGTVAIHRMDEDPGYSSLRLVHQLSLPFGPNLEGFSIDYETQTLRVWGFRGKHFVYYDANDQEEIMSVECGGAHRNWALWWSSSTYARCILVWTKASKVHYHLQPQRLCRSINAGGHGREIKAMAVSGYNGIIATGAEDTDIKLFALGAPQVNERGRVVRGPGFECLHTLRKHNTGIQHLAWDGEHLFSSGGFEEFFVWKVEFDVPCFEDGVVCESAHPRSGKSDLRICGFDVRRLNGEDEATFEISMAYSDSTLKVWQYASGAWKMLRAGDYLTSCLTHVLAGSEQTGILATASTDGHLARWQTGEDYTTLSWTERHKVHQSAIHALTSAALPDGSRLIATGGDDNAVAITRLSANGELKTLIIPRAHAAAVTGLALIQRQPDNGQGKFLLASVGIDQRIKLWEVSVDASQPGIDDVEVKKVQNVFTSVADASSLAIRTLSGGGKGVLVCGVGMDVWRLPTEKEAENAEDESQNGTQETQDS